MSLLERYIRAIGAIGTVVLGSITAWAVSTESGAPVLVLLGLATLFFLGLAVPAISDRVPQYQRVATVAIGLVGTGLFLLGHRFELVIAVIFVGAASGIDLVVRRFRAAAR